MREASFLKIVQYVHKAITNESFLATTVSYARRSQARDERRAIRISSWK